MTLRVCVLASGSSGNCIYVASGSTRLLIDAGLSCRQIQSRLEEMEVQLDSLSGVCVTHEHSDHTSALSVLHRREAVPIYGNAGTIEALKGGTRYSDLKWNVFTTGQPFLIGDCIVTPFSVPHDSYDPVGFVVRSGDAQVGIVTDAGMGTVLMRERMKGSNVIVVEANHDEQMLRDAKRPWSLKQRIAGRQGHLSNQQAADLVADIAGPGTSTVFLCHLSSDCNRPKLAMRTVSEALQRGGHTGIEVKLTYADQISEVIDIA